MISTADALSGPWVLNVKGWLWTVIPTGAVIVAQEIATGFPGAEWIAASVILQLAAAAVWSITVVGLSRLAYGRVVPVAAGMLWIGRGAVQGVVGAGVALAAHLPPEWGFRLAFWIVASAFWMPLVTYALAQWSEHRRLLAQRDMLDAEIATATQRAAENVDSRAGRLAAAADNSLIPALEEIRAQLHTTAADIDPGAARSIARQLDDLAHRTAEFASVEPVTASTRPTPRVSVYQASIEFELQRPVFAGVLTALVTASPLLPQAYRQGSWWQVAEAVVAVGVVALVLVGAFALLRRFPRGGPTRPFLSVAGVLLAGFAGAATLLFVPWDVADGELPLAVILVVLVPVAAWAVTTAVALSATNRVLDRNARADRRALDELAYRLREMDVRSSARLAILLRGELNGRLAACAMSLAFLSSGTLPASQRDGVMANVLAQLDAAAADLRAP